MTQDVLKEFTAIFRDVLDNDDINLTDETTAADIDEWDSLTHVQLIFAIEKHFKIRFHVSDIHSFNNIGDMRRAVEKKLAS